MKNYTLCLSNKYYGSVHLVILFRSRGEEDSDVVEKRLHIRRCFCAPDILAAGSSRRSGYSAAMKLRIVDDG